jgi:DNA mismatch endonuclease Vsr
MSCGFQRHPAFTVVGAADAEIGKPSSGAGTLGCNASFRRNIGIAPLSVDLATIGAEELRDRLALPERPVVLSACAPCTGFSRTLARNHVVDDARNSLVARVGAFARVLRPEVIVMENARELLMGRFARHFAALRAVFEDELGYRVVAEVHVLSDFGLPQRRERALVVAARAGLPPLGLDDLWTGLAVKPEATTVRRAIAHLPEVPAGVAHASDPMHVSPRILSDANQCRLAATPPDGGSWVDLIGDRRPRQPPRRLRPPVVGPAGGDYQARVRPHRQRALRPPGPGPPVHGARAGPAPGVPGRLRVRVAIVDESLPSRRRCGAAARRPPGRRARRLDPRSGPPRAGGHGARRMQPDRGRHHRDGVAAPTDERKSVAMRAQRERDTGIEREIRSRLHARGLRFRVHRRLLKGSRREVDVVFPGAKVAVFVDGCFWHGCPEHGTWPRNNADFWRRKIEGNLERDRDTDARLEADGWTVVRVWEHEAPADAAARIADAVERR